MSKLSIFPAGEIYHICNKSIANYAIFKDPANIHRFLLTLEYYNDPLNIKSLSDLLREDKAFVQKGLLHYESSNTVKFIAYCIMPDHYHILIRPLKNNGVSHYMNNVQNSFTRYFNVKFKRKGPLWQSRFRAVRVTSNEQLLHVTRYIHLNPTTSSLVNKPEQWEFSSYQKYISSIDFLKNLSEMSIQDSLEYKKFCEDQIDYQRKLREIKRLLLE